MKVYIMEYTAKGFRGSLFQEFLASSDEAAIEQAKSLCENGFKRELLSVAFGMGSVFNQIIYKKDE